MPAIDSLLGSFIGDALALGPHWIYDAGRIEDQIKGSEGYVGPMSQYHPGKAAGDQTHYGDQALVLLRSIARCGEFDRADFEREWQEFWADAENQSYRDGATRSTLANLAQGLHAGSSSSDLAGASRLAPLLILPWPNDDALAEAARAQTSLTHHHAAVLEAADFFARLAAAVLRGKSVVEGFELEAARPWKVLRAEWFAAARQSSQSPIGDREALAGHGLTCDVAQGFPATCHLLLRYANAPAQALLANRLGGGDSAARGLLLGMILGADGKVFPSAWSEELRSGAEILRLAAQMKSR